MPSCAWNSCTAACVKRPKYPVGSTASRCADTKDSWRQRTSGPEEPNERSSVNAHEGDAETVCATAKSGAHDNIGTMRLIIVNATFLMPFIRCAPHYCTKALAVDATALRIGSVACATSRIFEVRKMPKTKMNV